jgi:chromate transport protein ChrA
MSGVLLERIHEKQCMRHPRVAMPMRERILGRAVAFLTTLGMTLPAAYALSIGLSEISGYLARLDALEWMFDYATLASVPWEVVATAVVIARWRDLPQRFWITYCVNGVLAYISLPIYLHHFGIFLY